MEIESVHKYIALNKQTNGNVEVMFAGQPCLTISESNFWKINPVFAKLVYGANIFEEIPVDGSGSSTTEEAVAAGLLKLFDLGAFRTEVDFPEDTYAATMNSISEEADQKVLAESIGDIFDSYTKRTALIKEATALVALYERDRSEFHANLSLSGDTSANKPPSLLNKKIKLKNSSGSVISSHDTENEAMAHFKTLSDTKGVKIVREENDIEVEIPFVNEQGQTDETDVKYDEWEDSVKKAYPDKKFQFKGRVEKGLNTTSAEIPGEDRAYGVWDHGTNTGNVFTPDQEAKEKAKVTSILGKNKKFTPKA